MPIKNAYTATSVHPGDTFVFTVKVMVTESGICRPAYRVYRCPWPDPEMHNGEPQGDRVYINEKEIVEALAPTIAYLADPDD